MKKLHSAQDAIEQAIEGGWRDNENPDYAKNHGVVFLKENKTGARNVMSELAILTDPLFWQALGTAREWRLKDPFNQERNGDIGDRREAWPHYAIRWFKNRISSGDEKQFWESLP